MTKFIRRLNDEGLNTFEKYINERVCNKNPASVNFLLEDERFSESLVLDIKIENRAFETRYDMGQYLTEIFGLIDMQPFLGDRGIWSWIALFWFDQLCLPNAKPSKPYNYILSSNYNHRPRHAIFTTWMLVNRYKERSRFLLSKAPDKRGELIEQLAARQHLINCKGVMLAADRLYSDNKQKTFKKGSTSRTRRGNVDRFIKYLQQLELTYDLGTITEDALTSMLPDEYSAFLNS